MMPPVTAPRHSPAPRTLAGTLAGAAGVLILSTTPAVGGERPLEGFGAVTSGGIGGEIYVVTTLEDTPLGEAPIPGSLKAAVSEPNRYITFAVGGTIHQKSRLKIFGHHLTIDGSTAPDPGITLAGLGMGMAESAGDTAHDIVVKNIRVIDGTDNLAIAEGAYNIVIDHCSFRRASDGNIDIFEGAHDITIQYCILAENIKNMLIRSSVSNVSVHHNLFAHGDERNPQCQQTATFVDIVNNVMFDWSTNYCTRVRSSSSANVINNVFIPGPRGDASDALVITDSAAATYVAGNVMPPNNDAGSSQTPLAAPPVEFLEALEAYARVIAEAGPRPLDADDAAYVADVEAATPVAYTSWAELKGRFADTAETSVDP